MALSAAETEARQKAAAKAYAQAQRAKRKAKKTATRTAKLQEKLKDTTGDKKRSSLKRKVKKQKEKLENYGEDRKIAQGKKRDALHYTETVKGKPGVKNPTVNPFLNAEDLMQLSDARTELAGKFNDLDYELERSRLDTDYKKAEIDRKHVQGISDVNDDAAGRGIFRSSIRDASLFDVDATSIVSKALLDSAFDTQLINTQTQKLAAQEAFDRVQAALDRKAVENAREVELEVGVWAEKPTADQEVTQKVDFKPPPKPQPKPDKPSFTPTGPLTNKPPTDGRGNEGLHTGGPPNANKPAQNNKPNNGGKNNGKR